MTGFATATAGPLSAEPHKRVNYTFGLVLGVDEFQQDQLYHAAGRRWHNSRLHGYGTVWGLAVRTPEPDDVDPSIRVTAGVAVDPCGREICVPVTMCVRLTSWLDRHRDTLEALFPGGATDLPLSVVLCYRECPDDVVPIPGEPCRTQEDAMQPSRLRDSFELRLALRDDVSWGSPPADNASGLHTFSPAHAEEAAVRAFGRLLSRVQLDNAAAPGAGLDELLEAVRALADGAEASPPAGEIALLPAEAAQAFHEAFRVWATEVRPRLGATPDDRPACGADDRECCVLLADIDLPVTAGWAVAGTAFAPREENRPILLHTRLLQEWVAAGPVVDDADDMLAPFEGDLEGMHPVATVVALQNRAVADEDPGDGDVLTWDDALPGWRPAAPAAAPPAPPAPPAPLPPATGDVSGTYPALTVTRLQTRPVADTAPVLNHYLRWNGTQWAPHHVGGFVIAPAGRYAVVGAGNFDQDGEDVAPAGPVYNDLQVRVSVGRAIDYLITFREYRLPGDAHTYIVHAALHAPDAEPVPLAFRNFGDDGVNMRLNGDRVEPTGRLIIEIHRVG